MKFYGINQVLNTLQTELMPVFPTFSCSLSHEVTTAGGVFILDVLPEATLKGLASLPGTDSPLQHEAE